VIRVAIPSHLSSYTAGAREVEAVGDTLAAVLRDLDTRYPGLRFRVVDEQDQVRRHIKLFVGSEMALDLGTRVSEDELVTITAALSGG
jgi:molybdopterin converting factor small subunit